MYVRSYCQVWNEYCHLNFQHNFSHILDFSHISYSILETNNHFTFLLTLTNDNIDTKEIPISLEHLMIVYFTVYRLISSVTAVKSIGSAKPGKARVINFKARAKPKARALEITGLFSITKKYWNCLILRIAHNQPNVSKIWAFWTIPRY